MKVITVSAIHQSSENLNESLGVSSVDSLH